jgi:hypothetical protein
MNHPTCILLLDVKKKEFERIIQQHVDKHPQSEEVSVVSSPEQLSNKIQEIRNARLRGVRTFVCDVADTGFQDSCLLELLLLNKTYNASVFIISSHATAHTMFVRSHVDHIIFHDTQRIFSFGGGNLVSFNRNDLSITQLCTSDSDSDSDSTH